MLRRRTRHSIRHTDKSAATFYVNEPEPKWPTIYHNILYKYLLQLTKYSLQLQPTSYSIQHTAYNLQLTAYSIQLIAYSIRHTAHSIRHTTGSIQLAADRLAADRCPHVTPLLLCSRVPPSPSCPVDLYHAKGF